MLRSIPKESICRPKRRDPTSPHLKRVLGRWDLVLLFVVAVFNLNVVPSIAANGGVTVWLWLIALLLFFWPQGIAVLELAHRFPGEGGVYLWAKEVFGDFHGFLSGWCYWTNNMLYVPTVMLYFVGVSVFVLGPGHAALADNKALCPDRVHSFAGLADHPEHRGTGRGQMAQQSRRHRHRHRRRYSDRPGHNRSIAVRNFHHCGGFQNPRRSPLRAEFLRRHLLRSSRTRAGFGHGRRDPRSRARTLPGAVAWGGVLSGLLYIGTTLTLLIAVSKNDISVLQGIVQAVSHMATKVGFSWIVAPFALMLSLSIAGIGSAWMGGSARIPFVAGLDSYMPSWLGKVHPRYATPYAALIVQFVVSLLLCVINFAASGGVQEAFQTMLSLAVVLQLVPFIYVFAALLKFAFAGDERKGRYNKSVLLLAGGSGLLTTVLGIVVAFSPAKQITSIWRYEATMFGLTLFFIALAAFFFFIYGRRKLALAVR